MRFHMRESHFLLSADLLCPGMEGKMEYIRRATVQDVSRIAEILVFNNRINYWPIFQDAAYSFGELQVVPLAEEYRSDAKRLRSTFVYEDGVIKGLVQVEDGEVKKLYVDPCFQNEGIGAGLLNYAVKEQGAVFLWALEKNVKALRFYEKHGFYRTNQRMPEEGTAEYLVKLKRR